MLKNTEAIICLFYFPTNFSIVPVAAICYSRQILFEFNLKFNTN